MSEKNGPPMTYTLFGWIQHEGMSCSSGHYVANVRCGTRWYHFNDSSRYIRSGPHCVNENSAYILFYIKDNGPTPQIGPSVRAHNGQNTVPGIRAENEKKIKPQTNEFGYSPTVIKTSANNHQQLKKHKKHKKRKHHEREHNYAEVCDDSISRSHKKKKKKKHKHKDRDEDREERKHKKHKRRKMR
ncbi:ubiquitin carboxyl-terminal hydrolase 42-like [Mercenaria mercenaria]|uniref:ubiquitin carboxyl-terminal hydrolase 42-like n=1 Tax=Mercenaria mercenaria TaxID=6596 RepID=UPI00234F60CD|nr:ubiquitin carboxyl-terminal hydrolase 42-like [Mercenaria mercenaria]